MTEVTDALHALDFPLRSRLFENMILFYHEPFSRFPSSRMLHYYAKASFDSGAPDPDNASFETERERHRIESKSCRF
jgi:hypothetical protein